MSEGNLKVPSQIFRWFEKMKSNYELTIASVLEKFESNTEKQQARIDHANSQHIADLKSQYQQQLQDKDKTIAQQQADIDFFKAQLTQQQQIMASLNSRYDAIINTFLSEQQKNNIKNIFEHDALTTSQLSKSTTNGNSVDLSKNSPEEFSEQDCSAENPTEHEQDIDLLFEAALEYRQNAQHNLAFPLFLKAAQAEHTKAMGAVARAYFLNEGTEENPLLGLAWLLKAAENGFAPAQSRCQYYESEQPELYAAAIDLVEQL